MPVILRYARPEDAEGICEVYKFSILDLCADHYTLDQLLAWAEVFQPHYIRRAISDGNTIFLIVEKDNRMAGFCILYESIIRALHIHPLFVRQGIGSMLLRIAENEARKEGVQILHVTASLNSRTFYEKNGFRLVSRGDFPLPGNLTMHCLKMEKALKE